MIIISKRKNLFLLFLFMSAFVGCSGSSESPDPNAVIAVNDPVVGPVADDPVIDPAPDPLPVVSWKDCAKQGEYCFFEGVATVRYGVDGRWVDRELQAEAFCDVSTFDSDPAQDALKTCQVKEAVSLSDTAPLYWHHPATWPNGQVPIEGSTVTIPSDLNVLLDRPISVEGLMIDGALTCLERDLSIDAFWIMVHGNFTCGTAEVPYLKKLVITLFGQPDSPTVMDMGNKLLGTMRGGELHLHGRPNTSSWLKLNATARAGDTFITLNETPTWQPGDHIVLASTSENMNEAEVRTIQSVNGVFVSLTQPLEHDHFGQRQAFDNQKGGSWLADTRGEVGLLTRNITIKGDASSAVTQHGAHVMTMAGSKAFIDNVTFNEVGQLGLLGRYPFHWHFAGDVTGQYIKNSSIYTSYNRCVTVHQTDYALVQNNVCYNHIGHGYFLEDGVERFNTIDGNLSVNAIRPDPELAILESDHKFNRAGGGPSNFWISHPTNTVTNNVAAGGDGTGFWYFLEDQPVTSILGLETRPSDADYLAFHNNSAHSVSVGYSSCRFGGVFGWESTDITINNLLVHNARDSGIWPCSGRTQTFNNLMILDSGRHSDKAAFTAPNGMTVDNSLFVANSALSDLHNSKVGRTAYGHYDQGSIVKNTLFVNYTAQANSGIMGLVGGAVKRTKNRMENVSFIPAQYNPYPVAVDFDNRQTVSIMTALHDDDRGSLTGFPSQTIVPWHTLFEGLEGCKRDIPIFDSQHSAAVCDFRYIRARIEGLPQAAAKDYIFFRRDADESVVKHGFIQLPIFDFIQSFTTANRNYHFGVEFKEQPVNTFKILFDDAWPGDTFEYELSNIGAQLTTVRGFRRVSTLAELKSATDDVYTYDGNSIRLKGTITGVSKWDAKNKVYVD